MPIFIVSLLFIPNLVNASSDACPRFTRRVYDAMDEHGRHDEQERIRDRSEIPNGCGSHPATESGAATGTASKRIQLIKSVP